VRRPRRGRSGPAERGIRAVPRPIRARHGAASVFRQVVVPSVASGEAPPFAVSAQLLSRRPARRAKASLPVRGGAGCGPAAGRLSGVCDGPDGQPPKGDRSTRNGCPEPAPDGEVPAAIDMRLSHERSCAASGPSLSRLRRGNGRPNAQAAFPDGRDWRSPCRWRPCAGEGERFSAADGAPRRRCRPLPAVVARRRPPAGGVTQRMAPVGRRGPFREPCVSAAVETSGASLLSSPPVRRGVARHGPGRIACRSIGSPSPPFPPLPSPFRRSSSVLGAFPLPGALLTKDPGNEKPRAAAEGAAHSGERASERDGT